MKKNDGGFAFPMGFHPKANPVDQCGGLTVRQWYAGMALQGMLASGLSATSQDKAEAALRYADALIEAESQEEKE